MKTKKQKRSSPEMENFFSRIQVKTKKKGLYQKWNTFLVLTCAQMYTRVKLLEGMQMKTILKMLESIQPINWGIYPPIPVVCFKTTAYTNIIL